MIITWQTKTMVVREQEPEWELLRTTAAREQEPEWELLSTTTAREQQPEWDLLSTAAKRPREKQEAERAMARVGAPQHSGQEKQVAAREQRPKWEFLSTAAKRPRESGLEDGPSELTTLQSDVREAQPFGVRYGLSRRILKRNGAVHRAGGGTCQGATAVVGVLHTSQPIEGTGWRCRVLTCRTVRCGISQCEEFLELSQVARLDLVGELNSCRLCLAHCEGKIKHKKCKWRNKIRDELCQEQNKGRRSHNRLLHVGGKVMRNLQAARTDRWEARGEHLRAQCLPRQPTSEARLCAHKYSASTWTRDNTFRRTPERSERSQLLWILPGQNSKRFCQCLHFVDAYILSKPIFCRGLPSNRVMSSQSGNVVTCTVNFCCCIAGLFMKI
jgi:hypothetical protein